MEKEIEIRIDVNIHINGFSAASLLENAGIYDTTIQKRGFVILGFTVEEIMSSELLRLSTSAGYRNSIYMPYEYSNQLVDIGKLYKIKEQDFTRALKSNYKIIFIKLINQMIDENIYDKYVDENQDYYHVNKDSIFYNDTKLESMVLKLRDKYNEYISDSAYNAVIINQYNQKKVSAFLKEISELKDRFRININDFMNANVDKKFNNMIMSEFYSNDICIILDSGTKFEDVSKFFNAINSTKLTKEVFDDIYNNHYGIEYDDGKIQIVPEDDKPSYTWNQLIMKKSAERYHDILDVYDTTIHFSEDNLHCPKIIYNDYECNSIYWFESEMVKKYKLVNPDVFKEIMKHDDLLRKELKMPCRKIGTGKNRFKKFLEDNKEKLKRFLDINANTDDENIQKSLEWVTDIVYTNENQVTFDYINDDDFYYDLVLNYHNNRCIPVPVLADILGIADTEIIEYFDYTIKRDNDEDDDSDYDEDD